jgi:polysaccharide export outer membrane protein
MPRILISLLLALLPIRALPANAKDPAPAPGADPSYRLTAGDTVTVAIYGEPELAATQTIGRGGEVRLPLIGEILLAGQTVREAERLVESTYLKRQFLKVPVANLIVVAYFPREVSVLGAVRTPGTIVFPRDATSLDIVEIITRAGGFLPISKADAVTLTRRLPDGTDRVIMIDLDNVMSGRRKPGRDRIDLAVYPGDRVWVPERLF